MPIFTRLRLPACLSLLLSLSITAFGQKPAASLQNLARGSVYRVTASYPDSAFLAEETRYPDTTGTELTDGIRAAPSAPYTDPAWQGWALQDRRIITLDLKRRASVRAITVHLGLEPSLAIFLPENIAVSVSDDGARWSSPVRTAPVPAGETQAITACPVTIPLTSAPTARYVQVQVDVKRWVFAEEIEVMGTPLPTNASGKDTASGSALDRIVHERQGLLEQARMVGWLQPGSRAAGGARHISLMYVDGAAREGLNPEHYKPYVAYVDEAGKPKDTLFDSFLFLPSVRTATGRIFAGADNPAYLEDWTRFLDQIFQPDFQLAALDRAAAQTASALKRPVREKVIIAIPFPAPLLKGFGMLPGTTSVMDFDASPSGRKNRLNAINCYHEEVLKRWQRAAFAHLDLIGFYWFAEEVTAADRSLVREFADRVHRDPAHRFFWIPYFQANSIREWKEMGFDAAMLQPNLSFSTIPPEKSAERLQSAANQAAHYGLGLEIELHWTLTDPARRAHYLAYLHWGEKLGYRDRAVLSYYQSVSSLREASGSSDPDICNLYDATYRFVKGRKFVQAAEGSDGGHRE